MAHDGITKSRPPKYGKPARQMIDIMHRAAMSGQTDGKAYRQMIDIMHSIVTNTFPGPDLDMRNEITPSASSSFSIYVDENATPEECIKECFGGPGEPPYGKPAQEDGDGQHIGLGIDIAEPAIEDAKEGHSPGAGHVGPLMDYTELNGPRKISDEGGDECG